MAESSLTLTYVDFSIRVADYLGLSRNSGNWSSSEQDRIDQYVNAGLKRFLQAHNWSFFRERATITTAASDYDYALADNCANVEGPLLITGSSAYPPIDLGSEDLIIQLQTANSGTGFPQIAALRPLAFDQTATGTRWEIIFWPTPDAVYTISYNKVLKFEELSSTNLYAPGGPYHDETMLAAMKAEAEADQNDGEEFWEKRYQRKLAESKDFDQRTMRTERMGMMYDPGINEAGGIDRSLRRNSTVTFDGTEY